MPEIKLEELDLAALKDLQGGAALAQFMTLMSQCVLDVKNRPGEKRPRKLLLQLELRPKAEWVSDPVDEGKKTIELSGVGLTIRMDAKLPARHTLEYDCGVTEGNRLVFNPDSPLNHRLPTLPFDDPAENPAVKFSRAQ